MWILQKKKKGILFTMWSYYPRLGIRKTSLTNTTTSNHDSSNHPTIEPRVRLKIRLHHGPEHTETILLKNQNPSSLSKKQTRFTFLVSRAELQHQNPHHQSWFVSLHKTHITIFFLYSFSRFFCVFQGIDLVAGGKRKKKIRTAPKSNDIYLKLLVKVLSLSLSLSIYIYIYVCM